MSPSHFAGCEDAEPHSAVKNESSQPQLQVIAAETAPKEELQDQRGEGGSLVKRRRLMRGAPTIQNMISKTCLRAVR